jgi:hypothetical protein
MVSEGRRPSARADFTVSSEWGYSNHIGRCRIASRANPAASYELRGLPLFLMEQTDQGGQLFMPVFADEVSKLDRNNLRSKLR